MRRGMVGCFMSHVKLHCELIYDDNADAYLILEDDITITDDFQRKYNILLNKLQDTDWDFCFLGHHLRNLETQNVYYNKTDDPEIEKISVYKSFILSLGGTTGYLISKAGAKRFLDFLDSTGATNGIDTCMQKSADDLNVYYPTPHLIFSDCCRNDSEKVDSDIQYDYSYLEKSIDERIEDEIRFYKKESKVLIHIYEFENLKKYAMKTEITHPSYYRDEDLSRIQEIKNTCIHPYYMVGDQCIFIVPVKMNRYFHRYMINDVYSVEDAIKY
jgi:GR25 family glycosyltransferase involved in LPS biosynthesis